MSVIAGSTTDAIRCENRLIKFLLQLLVLAMLQFVYVVYVAVYAFLLRRARAVVGEIPCQICRSEILGIDVTSTTRESLKESKEQLASRKSRRFYNFKSFKLSSQSIKHLGGSGPSCFMAILPLFEEMPFFLLLFINSTWNLKPETLRSPCLFVARQTLRLRRHQLRQPLRQDLWCFYRGDGGGEIRVLVQQWYNVARKPRIYHLGLGTNSTNHVLFFGTVTGCG